MASEQLSTTGPAPSIGKAKKLAKVVPFKQPSRAALVRQRNIYVFMRQQLAMRMISVHGPSPLYKDALGAESPVYQAWVKKCHPFQRALQLVDSTLSRYNTYVNLEK
jgi:hypothetical protein